MTLKIGQHLQKGRYEIMSHLGRGGMGTVYLAVDHNLLGRKVALKENSDTSPETQNQFHHEAVMLANLTHPNLPRVTDHFIEESGRQYLVMDFVEGQDLSQIVGSAAAPLPEVLVLHWIRQVIDALAYMHTRVNPENGQSTPIIHRDIKPSNIKCTPNDRIVLVDFGLAKYQSDQDMTQQGARAVSPGYSPIEQYYSSADAEAAGTDARSDIYSLGATLYRLLTNQAPPAAPLRAAGTALIDPRTFNIEVSGNTAEVILRAMSIKPEERYQTILEMQQALDRTNLQDDVATVAPSAADIDMARNVHVAAGLVPHAKSIKSGSTNQPAKASQPRRPVSSHPLHVPGTAEQASSEMTGGGTAPTPAPTSKGIQRRLLTVAAMVALVIAAYFVLSGNAMPAFNAPFGLANIAGGVVDSGETTGTGAAGQVESATATVEPVEPTVTEEAVRIASVGETNTATSTPLVETPSAEPLPTDTETVTPLPIETDTSTPIATNTSTATATATATPPPTEADLPEPLEGERYENPQDGAQYVAIPEGEFTRGSTESKDAMPILAVQLDGFWISETEVTNEQYVKCVQQGACTEPADDRWDQADFAQHPVTNVTWEQAQSYATWAGGRLPTEAEWEKAARGDDERIYPWGNEEPNRTLLNFRFRNDSAPVGNHPDGQSPYGALDMAGNVSEWTLDWFDPDYYEDAPTENPGGPESGLLKVVRGGAFNSGSIEDIRTSNRDRAVPQNGAAKIGFRVVIPIP